jgi:hypothetical protein
MGFGARRDARSGETLLPDPGICHSTWQGSVGQRWCEMYRFAMGLPISQSGSTLLRDLDEAT